MRRTTPLARRWALASILAALGFGSLALTACNTTEGAGRDIEAAGDAIADTARDAKD